MLGNFQFLPTSLPPGICRTLFLSRAWAFLVRDKFRRKASVARNADGSRRKDRCFNERSGWVASIRCVSFAARFGEQFAGPALADEGNVDVPTISRRPKMRAKYGLGYQNARRGSSRARLGGSHPADLGCIRQPGIRPDGLV